MDPTRRKHLSIWIGVVTAFAVLVTGGIYIFSQRDGKCVSLEISSSTEKAGLITQLAGEYKASGRTFGDDRCADITVHGFTSGAAMEALASGWDDAPGDAPAPQVWMPTTSLWVNVLSVKENPATILSVDTAYPSVAKSPLVIAMPEPMAQALGWPTREIGWRKLFDLAADPDGWGSVGHPEWGRFTLGKDNPLLSTSGMAATAATFYAATGRSGELTVDDVDDPAAVEFVRGVERSVLHYSDDAVNYMKNLYAADAEGKATSYVSAVAVQEQMVALYNQGNPTGDPGQNNSAPPSTRLVTIYPEEGTLVMDHPYVVMPGASEDQRAAAADFLEYLTLPDQQAVLQEGGFRGAEGNLSDETASMIGVPDDREFTPITPPKPEVLAAILDSWDEVRKRAQILLVMDVSGSMGDPDGNGQMRMVTAKAAAIGGLDRLHDDDEVALWQFSDEKALGTAQPYEELQPLTSIGESKQELTEQIGELSPGGGTALYRTVRAAHDYMVINGEPENITAIVVLTDGKNEDPKDTDLNGLLTYIDADDLERSVRVFSIAFDDLSDYTVLDQISTASRATAYDARNPDTLDDVFLQVISNF